MENLLQIRNTLISVFKKNEQWIIVILKFFGGLYVFYMLNKLGYAELLDKTPVVLLMGALSAILPASWFFLNIMIFITVHIFYASIEVSVVMLLAMLCLQLFVIRMYQKQSLYIILTFIAFYYKVPYFIPIFAGLFAGIASAIPVLVGTFVWFYYPQADTLINSFPRSEFDLMSLFDILPKLYTDFVTSLTSHLEWVYFGLTFVLVIVIISVISKVALDYSREISIGIGTIVNIIGICMASAVAGIEISVIEVILVTLISGILVYFCNFFALALDYKRAERVQFEDGEYYYYVKAIPKLDAKNKNSNSK